MDNALIGVQITRFRKAAGLTQEELGKAVGVSTQAVSRWECGGSPDIYLLPAIADTLGVDINALFGRESGEIQDVHEMVSRWARALPEEQGFDKLNRLIWSSVTQMSTRSIRWETIPYLKSCRVAASGDAHSTNIMASKIVVDQGIFCGVAAEDLAFSVLCPKPEMGYDNFFPDLEKARTFFALLAQPECLELLIYMMRGEERYYSVGVLARGMGKKPEVLTNLLEQLTLTGLMDYTEVEMLDGPEKVYAIGDACMLIPLFYLTNILTQEQIMFYMNYQSCSTRLI